VREEYLDCAGVDACRWVLEVCNIADGGVDAFDLEGVL